MGFVRRHRFALELALLALVAYLAAAGVTTGLGTAVDDVPPAPAEAAAAITPHAPGPLADYALIAERAPPPPRPPRPRPPPARTPASAAPPRTPSSWTVEKSPARSTT